MIQPLLVARAKNVKNFVGFLGYEKTRLFAFEIYWPLVISKFLQILGLQPRISKVFLNHQNNFFLTVGQNNFGNKIPFFDSKSLPSSVSSASISKSSWLWSTVGESPISISGSRVKYFSYRVPETLLGKISSWKMMKFLISSLTWFHSIYIRTVVFRRFQINRRV